MALTLDFRDDVLTAYPDVYTPEALRALEALAPLNERRRELMAERTARRKRRAESGARRLPVVRRAVCGRELERASGPPCPR